MGALLCGLVPGRTPLRGSAEHRPGSRGPHLRALRGSSVSTALSSGWNRKSSTYSPNFSKNHFCMRGHSPWPRRSAETVGVGEGEGRARGGGRLSGGGVRKHPGGGQTAGGLAPRKQSLTRLDHKEQRRPTRTTRGALVSLTLTPAGLRLSPAHALPRQLPTPLLGALVHLERSSVGSLPAPSVTARGGLHRGLCPGGCSGLCSPTAKAFRKPPPSQTQNTRTGPQTGAWPRARQVSEPPAGGTVRHRDRGPACSQGKGDCGLLDVA